MRTREELEQQLDSFDPVERRAALEALASGHNSPPAEECTNVNMHMHSFFSYNAQGYSPSRIAWETHRAGLYATGLCDFDVLDGLIEFLDAGLLLGQRTSVNLETRAYFREYADVDLSSPGEAGVTYIMGAGFYALPPAGSPQADELAAYRQRARDRNVDLMARINARLPEIAIDYEQDVLPLTPVGGATERHIVSAYVNRAHSAFPGPAALSGFWAGVTGKQEDEMSALLESRPALEDLVRAKLAKRGGLGYEQPSEGTFPPVDDFIRWVASCNALPMITWLDGTSGGEANARQMLECLAEKGASTLNIIPDRNWNVKEPGERATKQANLATIVREADDMGLPINIGTEMNKLGLPFVDDLANDALRPYLQTFLRGARIMVGHTVLGRYAAFPYGGTDAAAEFTTPGAMNEFFEAVGSLAPLGRDDADRLEQLGPEKALSHLRDAIRH